MTTVTYDSRSFLIDEKRIWLVSGSIHYFRTPAGLWRDRLLKAKRAGLNCISTYLAWNFHESAEGKWDFSGDHDVEKFIQQAGELGLYVILRPGPYIGAEWDSGGLPGWLAGKTGIAYRCHNAVYTHYYDKYFRQVLPKLAGHQVTRGGNIILIQNENEYLMTTMPERQNYLEFISQLFRRSGFDIPIINCNRFTDPPLSGSVESVNAWGDEVQQLKKMRLRQPDAPLLMTEFRPGKLDFWGGRHIARDACEVARRALEALGCGAQVNYYMWHGGTNFSFWGSRLVASDASYQTTSYDYDAPLAEGGGLTRKYYLTRLVNMLANHMGRFIAGATMESPGVSIHNATDVLNLSGPAGRWAILTNNGRDDIKSASVSLPDGRKLCVSLEPFGAAAIPVGITLTEAHVLNYTNLMPLGFFGQKFLLLHGPPAAEGRISINGQERCETIPDGDEPKVIDDHQGLSVVLVNSELAMRTWLVEDTLVFGPKFVGQSIEDVTTAAGAKQIAMIPLDGKLTHKKFKPAVRPRLTPPRLAMWKRLGVCTEPVDDNLKWQKLDRPRDVDHLGAHYGYLWYRIEIQQPRAVKRHLFLPECSDRAVAYLNGKLLGTWGRGDGADRSPMPANFKRGRNVLTLLVDNLGRLNAGPRLGELKGLFGHVFDAKPLRVKKPKPKACESFGKRIIPRQLSYMLTEMEKMSVFSADVDVLLTKVTPVHLSFTDVPHHVAVLCNDRVAGFFPAAGGPKGQNYGDVMLGSKLKKGKNVVKLLFWADADVDPRVLDNLKFHVLSESVSQGATWGFRQWQVPEPGGLIVGKDRPAWYITNFKYASRPEPLFLHIISAKKGQIFLNGHNVGRFWTVGPQQYYYLPECWLGEENELLIFEEAGNTPSGSRLAFRPLGPFCD
ncbi:MAG: beta-galactosidase [Planctomycetota bacterium]|nr:beta-galactosidase [Planctomycetota bacterium]